MHFTKDYPGEVAIAANNPQLIPMLNSSNYTFNVQISVTTGMVVLMYVISSWVASLPPVEHG